MNLYWVIALIVVIAIGYLAYRYNEKRKADKQVQPKKPPTSPRLPPLFQSNGKP